MPSAREIVRRLWRSLHASIGDVAFGMSDGAVSIAGLVFGVAASTPDSRIVLLAGASGAAAGAVSMMAGTYLDVTSERDRALALLDRARDRLSRDPVGHRERIRRRLSGAGFTDAEAAAVLDALARNPDAMLDYVAAFELHVDRRPSDSAWAHAGWMFIADLVAAATPVVPFALMPIDSARVVSLVITAALLVVLGIGRGRIAHKSIGWTAVQTLLIATAAAIAGIFIGHLVSG